MGQEKQLFTIEDYYKMADAGIIKPGDRVELIKGEIIKMSPIRSQHAGMVNILADILFQSLLKKTTIAIQNPIKINDFTEPEPDLLVAKYRKDHYQNGHPRPEDVFLLIEVADSSLEYDREFKSELYSEAGIPEYWIINLQDESIEIFRSPENGSFQQKEIIREKTETVICSTIGLAIPLSDIFF